MRPERKQLWPGLALVLFLSSTTPPFAARADTPAPHARPRSLQLAESTSVQAWPLVVIDTEEHPAAGGKGDPAAKQEAPVHSSAEREKVASEPQTKKNPSTEDMFGPRGGYFHPFFGIREEYTDNVYNIDADKVENLLTTISAGAWLSAPRLVEVPVGLSPHNAAVAGTRYSTPGSGSFERFQTYLLGALDYKTFSADADLGYTAWHVEGLYQQNLPVGISFRLLDRYTRDQDRFDIGSFQPQDFTIAPGTVSVRSTPSQIRNFASNQALFSTNVEMGERFAAMFSFINFYLDYEDEENGWLDRDDNSLGLTLSYKFSPKTSFFVEYDHAWLAYAEDSGNDSENAFFFGGISWQGSAKTSLMAKGGYQLKEYDQQEIEEADTFALEAHLNYLITDKTKTGFSLFRALEETDSLQNRGRETTAARLRYDQRFTYRIQGGIELGYEQNDYDGFAQIGINLPAEEGRRDTSYLVRPAVNYFFRDWLVAELSYVFEDHNSTDDFYDFATQTLFLSVNAAF